MALLQENRSKAAEEGENEKGKAGKAAKAKASSKAKGKAKGKAKAKPQSKGKGRGKGKQQASASGETSVVPSRGRSMKRPAAALCDSSAEDAGQTRPCEVHDAGPPTPEDPVDLPPTFARRAMPTSIKGNALEKYMPTTTTSPQLW